MQSNYPPDYDPRIDSGEDDSELFDENGDYIGPDENEDDDPQWEDKRLNNNNN